MTAATQTIEQLVDEVESTLTVDQRNAAELLRVCMGHLSETNFGALWSIDLEFTLWEFVVAGKDVNDEHGDIRVDQLDYLRELSTKCGGWIVWCDWDDGTTGALNRKVPQDWHRQCGERFLPMAEWLATYERYTARKTKHGPRPGAMQRHD